MMVTLASPRKLFTPFFVMPSLATRALLFAVIMAYTARLRPIRALLLSGVSGGQQRHAYVGQRVSVGIPFRLLKNRTAAQSLSCTAARSTDSRPAGTVSPAERIYQLAGREFEIGKPSILAKVGANIFVFACVALPCTRARAAGCRACFFSPNKASKSYLKPSPVHLLSYEMVQILSSR